MAAPQRMTAPQCRLCSDEHVRAPECMTVPYRRTAPERMLVAHEIHITRGRVVGSYGRVHAGVWRRIECVGQRILQVKVSCADCEHVVLTDVSDSCGRIVCRARL